VIEAGLWEGMERDWEMDHMIGGQARAQRAVAARTAEFCRKGRGKERGRGAGSTFLLF